MRRHEALHGNSTHTCQFCSRGFARRDVARRHAQSCPSKKGGDTVLALRRGRKPQTCDQCYGTKVACNKQMPCSRCSAGGLRCTYTRLDETPGPPDKHEPTESRQSQDSFFLRLTNPSAPTVDAFLAAEGPGSASTRPVRWAQARSDTNQAEMVDFNVLFLGSSYLWDGLSLDRWAQSRPPDPDGIYPLLSTTNNAAGALQGRLDVLLAQLKQLNNGKDPIESVNQLTALQTSPGNLSLFTEDAVLELIGSFFCRRHWQWPIIHWPTFDTEKVALPLLLAAALTGAASSHPDDDAAKYRLSARSCLNTAEEYIFAALEDIGVTTTASSGVSDEVIQICQAALLISALQTSLHDEETRRRVIMRRHPSLISALRRFGLMRTRHVPETQKRWSDFIRHESIIRLVTWTFLADSILPAFSNLPPCMTLSEMIGDLPSDDTIWNAATEAEFEDKWSSYMSMQRPPSLKQVVQQLLDEEGAEFSKGSYDSLDIHLLYLVLWGGSDVLSIA